MVVKAKLSISLKGYKLFKEYAINNREDILILVRTGAGKMFCFAVISASFTVVAGTSAGLRKEQV